MYQQTFLSKSVAQNGQLHKATFSPCVLHVRGNGVTHVISHTRPSRFCHAMLKSWEWPRNEAMYLYNVPHYCSAWDIIQFLDLTFRPSGPGGPGGPYGPSFPWSPRGPMAPLCPLGPC